MPIRRAVVPLAIPLFAFAVVAVPGAQEPRVEVPPYNTLTDDEEVALGKEAAEAIETEQHLTFVEASAVRTYVSSLVAQLARASRRPQMPYSIKVVDTADVNAFALPGGFLYVHRVLMEWARNESELAAALSHEINHVVGRHGANNISRMLVADSLLFEASRVLTGGEAPAKILKRLGGPVAFLAAMKFSREDELQADLLAYYNVQRAGWSPDGMVELFRHLGERSSNVDALLAFTSSHPLPADRQLQIVNEMRNVPPRQDLVHDRANFHSAQDALKRLPRPQPHPR